MELEHTQNKAQFGRRVRTAPGNLTASGIFYSEIGHWVVWFTRNSFGIKFAAIFFRRGLIHEIFIAITARHGHMSVCNYLTRTGAQAVVAWLTAHGVEASRLSAKGMGQTKPVAANSAEDGRAKNRHVELVKQ